MASFLNEYFAVSRYLDGVELCFCYHFILLLILIVNIQIKLRTRLTGLCWCKDFVISCELVHSDAIYIVS